MATFRSPRLITSSVCTACRNRLLSQTARRAFTTTIAPQSEDGFAALNSQLSSDSHRARRAPTNSYNYSQILEADSQSFLTSEWSRSLEQSAKDKPYRFHVFATKHNTHITFVQPPKPASETTSSSVSATSGSSTAQKKEIDVLLSVSAGNIGFKKAGRGSYDAAYQLAAYALTTMKDKGMLRDCRSVEVVLRGFGAGREAVTKVLLGSEGSELRPRITKVVDATRLKQGGPRSKKPRRLG